MDVTKHNKEAFDKGMAKVQTALKRKLLEKGIKVADELVSIAANAYDELDRNLTGNLLNSIAGGVYIEGVLERIVTLQDATSKPAATTTYVRVGDGGFVKYRTGEEVDYVMQYKGGAFLFQPVDKSMTGQQSAIEFLMAIRPNRLLDIVICAAAPYAAYLQTKRGLDVLTTAYGMADGVARTNFKALRVK